MVPRGCIDVLFHSASLEVVKRKSVDRKDFQTGFLEVGSELVASRRGKKIPGGADSQPELEPSGLFAEDPPFHGNRETAEKAVDLLQILAPVNVGAVAQVEPGA